MKILRNWMCLLTVLALVGSMAACGQQKEELNSTDSAVSSAEDEAQNKIDDDADVEEILAETDAPDEDAPIDRDTLVVQGQEPTDAPQQDTTEAATKAAVQNQNSQADSKPEQNVNNQTDSKTDSKPDQTQSQAPAQNSKPDAAESTTSSQAATQPSTEAPTEASTEAPTEAVDPENVVAGIIDLNNGISYEGTGITVSGNVITITGEGTYIVSGTLPDGMIEVNTSLKVKLKMNGVNITNSTGPAILVANAKRLTMTLIEGTENYLTGGSIANDGALCTNDTLEIKGAGTLHVNGTVEHGISSDDDIIVKNGIIHVNAVKTGMMANDDITVAGGELHVVGNTNGIKSKGTLNISGGSVWTVGGPKETKSALYCATGFTLTGGSIYAVGCGATEPDMSTSTQRALSVKFSPSLTGGSTAVISSGGSVLLETTPTYAYNTIFISTPGLAEGMTFNVTANGTDLGTHTLNGIVTSVTVG